MSYKKDEQNFMVFGDSIMTRLKNKLQKNTDDLLTLQKMIIEKRQ